MFSSFFHAGSRLSGSTSKPREVLVLVLYLLNAQYLRPQVDVSNAKGHVSPDEVNGHDRCLLEVCHDADSEGSTPTQPKGHGVQLTGPSTNLKASIELMDLGVRPQR